VVGFTGSGQHQIPTTISCLNAGGKIKSCSSYQRIAIQRGWVPFQFVCFLHEFLLLCFWLKILNINLDAEAWGRQGYNGRGNQDP